MHCTSFPGLVEALCERGKEMASGYSTRDLLEDEAAFPDLMQNAAIVGAEMALRCLEPLVIEVRRLLSQVEAAAAGDTVMQLRSADVARLRSLLPAEK